MTLDAHALGLGSTERRSESYEEFRDLLTFGATEEKVLQFSRQHLRPHGLAECEFFVLNLIRSTTEDRLRFDFGSKMIEGGFPTVRDVTWLAEYIKRQHYDNGDIGFVAREFHQSVTDFQDISGVETSIVTEQIPSAFERVWRRIADVNEGRKHARVRFLLVHDGELTFYSLLWGLLGSKTIRKQSGEVQGDFGLGWRNDGIKRVDMSLEYFLQSCGLLVRDETGWEFSDRWDSMLCWLDSEVGGVIDSIGEYFGGDNGGVEFRTWAKRFREHSKNEVFDEFSKSCFDLRKSLTLPSQQAEDDIWTPLELKIFNACKAPFLPWEYFLRAWQPYPIHLLIVPAVATVGSPLTADSGRRVPHTIAFASLIAANMPLDVDEQTRVCESRVKLLGLLGEAWAHIALEKAAQEHRRKPAKEWTFKEFWALVNPKKWGHDPTQPIPSNQENVLSGNVFAKEAEEWLKLDGALGTATSHSAGHLLRAAYHSMKGCWAQHINEKGESRNGYNIFLGTLALILAFVAKKNHWELPISLNRLPELGDTEDAFKSVRKKWTKSRGARFKDIIIRKAVLNAVYDLFHAHARSGCVHVKWSERVLSVYFPMDADGSMQDLEDAVKASRENRIDGGVTRLGSDGSRIHLVSDALSRLELLAGVDYLFCSVPERPAERVVYIDEIGIGQMRCLEISFVGA